MRKHPLTLALALLCAIAATAQSSALTQSFMIPDTAAMTYDGLVCGYKIKTATEKEVGSKGNFSRYSLQFYIYNNTREAKLFLYNDGWQLGNDVSPYIVQFDIQNATGARFTSKQVQLQLSPAEVLAEVPDKNNNNKPAKQFVRIGYWLKPGEMRHSDAIVIVPLNELPRVQATLYPNMNVKVVANALQLRRDNF